MTFIMAGRTDIAHEVRRVASNLSNRSGLGYVERAMTPSDAPLTMYTTSWCGYCSRLKIALKSEGIAYAEVDIESDPAAAEFVMSVNRGNQTVPTVKFPDGSTMTNPSARDVKAKLR
jgi:mycoredoxin